MTLTSNIVAPQLASLPQLPPPPQLAPLPPPENEYIDLMLGGGTQPTFKKTAKQTEATKLQSTYVNTLLEGGARSGKTLITLRNVFIRAMRVKSRHLVARFRFNHINQSVIMGTLPEMMRLCFPLVSYHLDKNLSFVTLPNGSEVWFAGLDDKDRIEKVLGNEYSTVYLNECSQISWEAVVLVGTRLAENAGLINRMFFDCNPPGRRHWTHKLFHEKIDPDPDQKKKVPLPDPENYAVMKINPKDNRENLPSAYLKRLDSLPKKARDRFRDGLYGNDIEGALWETGWVEYAKIRPYEDLHTVIVAVDPSTTNNPGSDECGIIVAGLDDAGAGVVMADRSGKMSTGAWANRVVSVYHEFEANYIVAEVNQGGDLVKDAIHAIDPLVKIVTVHASHSKKARAEPVSALYEPEQNRIAHADCFMELEGEMTEWVPTDTKESPNRLDALVWALTFLFFPKTHGRTDVRALIIPDGG